ncbi:dihydrodipicolinate synthase family protein [Haloferax sp. ATB1]|uniref:dihydrodipicolinate synthase family protein n=1 Tax=Haloferax sp. ATB1 TaxID=1508454 RepID=UPI0005B208AD|nr:dihydrodipicolinate synthase family protein [Haloferax sp. ATB1]
MRIEGAITPMVTPIGENAAVSTDSLASFTEFLVENGVDYLFPCGSIGEFPSFTQEEQITIMETVIRHAGETPVLVGCGGTSLKEVRTLITEAEALGADAAVVVTPYYFKPKPEGVCSYYEKLLSDTDLPIIIYEIPAFAKTELPIETVVELSQHDQIIGIKDSTGDIVHHQKLLEETPEDFSVLQGQTKHLMASLDLGADGFVASPLNVFPEPVSEIYTAYSDGDRERARRLWDLFCRPIVSAIEGQSTAAALKYLLQKQGYTNGTPVLPLQSPNELEQDELDRVHDELTSAANQLTTEL